MIRDYCAHVRFPKALPEEIFARAIKYAGGNAKGTFALISIPPPCSAQVLNNFSLIRRARNDKRLSRPCAFSEGFA